MYILKFEYACMKKKKTSNISLIGFKLFYLIFITPREGG
jgi:hypothetical protein